MSSPNRSCQVITITTPKKFLLNGLWFGGEKPKEAIIFVHGLTATAFSNHKLVVPLVSKDIAVVTFGNRSHNIVTQLKKVDHRKKQGYTSVLAGKAHEIFTDCLDDLQGVINFTKDRGVKNIYLAGHSTGCQKSVYFLSKKGKQQQVKGVVLICPLSDYAAAIKTTDPQVLRKATQPNFFPLAFGPT